jgi:hypothetical protein
MLLRNARSFSVPAALIACCPYAAHAQFTDPRTYTQAAVGINQAELDYIYARADASLDASLEVVGAHFEQNAGALSYTHNFGMLGQLAWAKVNLPFADVKGSIAGTGISRSVSGIGDASLQVTTLVQGGKALNAAEFENYKPETTLGVSMTITAPTGEYDPGKLLNLGSHRWSFKPEFGVSYPFGSDRDWVLDGYANIIFFTDNTTYHGKEILRQEPLPGFEAHISHDFTQNFWASLDLRYAFRGGTFVDSVNQDDAQESLVGGAEATWSPTSNQTLVFVWAKALVYKNAPSESGVALKYIYQWGGNSK